MTGRNAEILKRTMEEETNSNLDKSQQVEAISNKRQKRSSLENEDDQDDDSCLSFEVCKFREFEDSMKSNYKENEPGTSQASSSLSQLRLSPHPMYCNESTEDMKKLDNRIQISKDIDPNYINKLFKLPIYTEHIGYGFFGDIKMLRPIHHAAACGHFKCVQILIEAGAKADVVTSDGFNAIHYAIYHGYRSGEDEKNNELVKYLLKHNVMPLVLNRKPHYSKTYLIECCVCRNNIEMLKILLETGLPLEEFIMYNTGEICVPDKGTPLTLAIKYYKLEAFTLLLFHGASLVWYPSEYDRRVSFYSIPHYCLRNYKNPNMILSLFEIYQQFGGNMWIEDSNHGENTNQFLLPSVLADSQRLEHVIDDIQEMICNPLKLQNMCRVKLRKLMGRKYWCNIDKLPLPSDLKDFLRYSELLIQ